MAQAELGMLTARIMWCSSYPWSMNHSRMIIHKTVFPIQLFHGNGQWSQNEMSAHNESHQRSGGIRHLKKVVSIVHLTKSNLG